MEKLLKLFAQCGKNPTISAKMENNEHNSNEKSGKILADNLISELIKTTTAK